MTMRHGTSVILLRLGAFILLLLGLGLVGGRSQAAGPPLPTTGAPPLPLTPGAAKGDAAKPGDLDAPAVTPGCALQWRFSGGITAGVHETDLTAMAAISSADIWAVGYTTAADYSEHTLIEHWDGAGWSVVPSPDMTSTYNILSGVSAFSASDIWAVGNYSPAANMIRPLSLHWNGIAWSVVPVADPGGYSYFTSVTNLGPNEVWAAGEKNQRTLIMHEANGQWYTDTTPNVGAGENLLRAIAARAPNDIWAVGWAGGTLTLHWAGSVWVVVDSSSLASGNSTLYAVLPLAANDVWTVGGSGTQALIGHWNGLAWSAVASPQPGTIYSELKGLAGTGPNDLWAVGEFSSTQNVYQTMAVHWNGGSWTAYPTLNKGVHSNTLLAVVDVAPSTVFAAGYNYDANDNDQPLIEQYTEDHQFTDVPGTNAFYGYIHCLACRGIIGGYPCGGPGEPCDDNNTAYYHIGAPVIRGQLAKIVSNAGGFSDVIPPAQQTFADVAPGSTYWLYSERAALHGVIGGYPCGSAGEPCDPQQRPYFRPSNTATRGQISKIVASARGYTDVIQPTQQTFSDVLPNSTYWVYIERLSLHGVIGGYPCGSAGEPCDPQQRPYFRIGLETTRGQLAKIASISFFPGC